MNETCVIKKNKKKTRFMDVSLEDNSRLITNKGNLKINREKSTAFFVAEIL